MEKHIEKFWKLAIAFDGLEADNKYDIEKYLFEKYKETKQSKLLKTYYFVKPLIPRKMQIFLRRKKARTQEVSFPHWPIEEKLEDMKRDILKNLRKGKDKIPFIWFWPHGKNFAVVLTHDVETSRGLSNIETICGIEKKYGFRSSWNFVPERYTVNTELLEGLSNDGFEIGIHGLKHDGKLFNSKQIYERRMNQIEKYASEWGAVGFRSPSTHRNPDWMINMPFEYDSSFPDTDPYEPQPGGCLSIFPFFIGNLLELPITLAQDHTLFEILGYKDISIWKQKIAWIEKMNGMVLLVVHPDYMFTDIRLGLYEDFLKILSQKSDFYHALPCDVANWWRRRDRSNIKFDSGGKPHIEGPLAEDGIVAHAELSSNKVNLVVMGQHLA